MGQQVVDNTFLNNLMSQYDWFNSAFCPAFDISGQEFFNGQFSFKLMSLSLNINAMFQDDSYFVTKINIEENKEIFIRCSEKAVGMILDRVLESNEEAFSLNAMSELEAKIITSFNDYFYNEIAHLIQRPEGTLKFRTFDILHMTFLVKPKDDENNENVAKIIVSLPYQFVRPNEFVTEEENFTNYAMRDNNTEVNIRVGTTRFSVQDLKALEEDDIVIFENSNINIMKVICGEYVRDFQISPNTSLIIGIDDIGEGVDMENPEVNLWDSIQIEMSAEFDKIKMPLGDLKKIDEGMVIDVSSIYTNKITLKVENKLIADGELVIINDRYGVKVNKVFANKEQEQVEVPQVEEVQNMEYQQEEGMEYQQANPEMMQQEYQQEGVPQTEGDFDYSDFDLEDDDI